MATLDEYEYFRQRVNVEAMPGVVIGQSTRFDDKQCRWCGGVHLRACPRVKKMEYHESGGIKSVTYFKAFKAKHIVWPEDVFDEREDVVETDS